MKRTSILMLLAAGCLLCTACDAADKDKALNITSDNTPSKPQTVYSDYYSGSPSLITDFEELSIDLSGDSGAVSETGDAICFTDDYMYLCDVIEPEEGKNIQKTNGIVGVNQAGEKIRICPEPYCSVSDICNHIAFTNGEKIISHENYLYICGTPYLDTGYYPRTCIMQYNLSTKEYIKYAEIPAATSSLFTYSNYLFAAVPSSDTTIILYCFDLTQNIGYTYTFSSDFSGPKFLGAAYNHLIAADYEKLYLIDGSGSISKTLELNECIVDFDFYNGTLYFSLDDLCIYQYYYANNTYEQLISNGHMFEVYSDTIYYLPYEEVTGLKYKISHRDDETGQIVYEIVDYPLINGNSIYTYSLGTAQTSTFLTADSERFLSGALYVSDFGLVYEGYINNETPQQSFPSMTVFHDLTSGDETILTTFLLGKLRSFGQ